MQVTTFWGIMITLLAAQTALFYWKKRHKRSYELVGWPGHTEAATKCLPGLSGLPWCRSVCDDKLMLPLVAAAAPIKCHFLAAKCCFSVVCTVYDAAHSRWSCGCCQPLSLCFFRVCSLSHVPAGDADGAMAGARHHITALHLLALLAGELTGCAPVVAS